MNENNVIRLQQNKGLTLYHSIALLVIGVILVAFIFSSLLVRNQMDNIVNVRLGSNAAKISETLRHSPEIIDALSKEGSDEKVLSYIVNNVSNATNASIVLFNAKQEIKAVYNPTTASLLKENNGSRDLKSFEGLPPNIFKNNNVEKIENAEGKIVGYVLVGFPEDVVGNLNKDIFNLILVASLIGLAIGVLGAYFLASKIKKTLFNFEPETIAALLEERNALINNVSEGIIALNQNLDIQFINENGFRLLKKASVDDYENLVGKSFALISKVDAAKKVLQSGTKLENIDSKFHGLELVVSYIPVKYRGDNIGVIASATEKSSVQNMAERLTGVTNYADALRAQTHEFMNKMHVINGLLTTGEIDELKNYVHHVSSSDDINMDEITSRIEEPLLSGFLIGKRSRANELKINFTLDEESTYPAINPPNFSVHDIILIVGNLLENSFDVLRHQEGERIVNLTILTYEDEEIIVVENNGPIIPKELLNKIYDKGYSTKGKKHGYGLALIKEKVSNLKGTIITESDENGTVFTVKIPVEGVKLHD